MRPFDVAASFPSRLTCAREIPLALGTTVRDNWLVNAPPSKAVSGIYSISYAHKDGAAAAARLQKDLSEDGFDSWLDTRRLYPGASWTKSIEEALDRAECIIALLSPGSYTSEICRAEQLRALRKGKCVIPLLVQPGADIPLILRQSNIWTSLAVRLTQVLSANSSSSSETMTA